MWIWLRSAETWCFACVVGFPKNTALTQINWCECEGEAGGDHLMVLHVLEDMMIGVPKTVMPPECFGVIRGRGRHRKGVSWSMSYPKWVEAALLRHQT